MILNHSKKGIAIHTLKLISLRRHYPDQVLRVCSQPASQILIFDFQLSIRNHQTKIFGAPHLN